MEEQNSYIDEMVLNQVCRLKPLSSDEYEFFPYNCIGFIKAASITQPGQTGTATGFLITGCLVLTAAHTFYSLKFPYYCQSKPIFFQLQQSQDKITKTSILNYCINDNYSSLVKQLYRLSNQKAIVKRNKSANMTEQLDRLECEFIRVYRESQKYDYALLKLDKVIQRPQYFQLKIPEEDEEVRLSGYTPAGQKVRMQYQVGTAIMTPTAGKYDIDSKRGQSGSPIMLEKAKSIVIGIHKGYDRKHNLNVCCLISEEMIINLQNWSQKFNLKIKVYSQQSSNMDPRAQLQLMKKQIEQLRLQLKQIKENRQSKGIPYINDHSFNPHHQKFHTELKDNKLVITMRQWDGISYTFIKNGAIPLNAVTTYKIRQTKSFKAYICTGIATDTVFGKKDSYWDKEGLSYDSNNGNVWENGGFTNMGRFVKDGEVITMQVDTSNWRVKWNIGQEVLAAMDIPEVMKNKNLYVILIMLSKNDVMELLFE